MEAKAAAKRPNIILILADDLGYGDLGCYGSRVHATPRLDRMAAEGTLFTEFYVAAPLCSPSRAALMTGCYPRRVGLARGHDFGVLLPGDPIGLSPQELTIARLLQQAGYATRIVGKWHLGDQPPFLPTRHGFDGWFGLPTSNDHHPYRPADDRTHLPPRFRDHPLPPLPVMRDEQVIETNPDQSTLTERYTDDAVEFIRSHVTGAGARPRAPFFLYMAHMYVHTPLHPPAEYLARSRNGPYGAEVEHLDACTGRLLDVLAELGIERETLVIFLSDNGAAAKPGGSNAPLRGWKNTTWEGGMREPCLMRWPGTIAAGRRVSGIATAMDLLPTLARLAGAEVPRDRRIDGLDLAGVLLGGDGRVEARDALYYYKGNDLCALRSGRWKLHLDQNLLFDLEADVGETTDLLAAHPEVAARLQALASECRGDLGDARTGAEGSGCRPAGRVENPRTLTGVDPFDPHVQAAYD